MKNGEASCQSLSSSSSIDIDGVTILDLSKTGSLELNIRLEIEDTTIRYILYAPYPEPAPEK